MCHIYRHNWEVIHIPYSWYLLTAFPLLHNLDLALSLIHKRRAFWQLLWLQHHFAGIWPSEVSLWHLSHHQRWLYRYLLRSFYFWNHREKSSLQCGSEWCWLLKCPYNMHNTFHLSIGSGHLQQNPRYFHDTRCVDHGLLYSGCNVYCRNAFLPSGILVLPILPVERNRLRSLLEWIALEF